MITKQLGKEYVYIFVRKDLSPERRLVQACHAALESGILFCDRANYSLLYSHTLVILSVKNEQELNTAFDKISSRIKSVMFFENDLEQNTAFATRPVSEEEREVFKEYSTLKYERSFLYYLKIFIRNVKGELFD
ncbi:MAG: hypothetical protein WC523_00465 [Patescibacteria group bacterium]